MRGQATLGILPGVPRLPEGRIALVSLWDRAYTARWRTRKDEVIFGDSFMRGLSLWNRRLLCGLAVVLIAGGAGGFWLWRDKLLSWYYLRGLSHAEEGERAVWLERVASLGSAAVPGLVKQLGGHDERACANACAALDRISLDWTPEDTHWSELTTRLSTEFGGFSRVGRCGALELATTWLRLAGRGQKSTTECGASRVPATAIVQYGANLVEQGSRQSDSEVRGSALEVAGALMAEQNWAGGLGPCRDLARACLHDSEAKNRARAVQLALCQGIDLLDEVIPLLRDPAAEVRRAVVLAVGGSRKVISDEELALALHDPDVEVRRLCERALRGRGLTEKHIFLARLVTDRRPSIRLRVLYHLHEDSGLDVGLWLRLLSQDPADEVRLAAIRAAVEQGVIELKERMEQMCLDDPSPTVRQWSRNYLDIQKRDQASLAVP
jgi:hypothetical protein